MRNFYIYYDYKCIILCTFIFEYNACFIGINGFYINIFAILILIHDLLCMLTCLLFYAKWKVYFCKSSKPPALLALIKITGFEKVLRSLDPTQDTN